MPKDYSVSMHKTFNDGKRVGPLNAYRFQRTGTYAISAAPKIPNLRASPFFSTVGGLKDVETRLSSDIIVASPFLVESR